MPKQVKAAAAACALACVLALAVPTRAVARASHEVQTPAQAPRDPAPSGKAPQPPQTQPQPAPPAPPANRAEVDHDIQEMRAYRLSMPKVKQMAAATLAFAREVQNDPNVAAGRSLDKEIDALEHKGLLSEADQKHLDELRAKREALDSADGHQDEGSLKTISDMERRIEKEPRLAAAIKGAGMSTREYSLVTLTFFQAMFAHMMQKSGSLRELPKDVSPENVKFVADNEAELTQIFSELQAHDKP